MVQEEGKDTGKPGGAANPPDTPQSEAGKSTKGTAPAPEGVTVIPAGSVPGTSAEKTTDIIEATDLTWEGIVEKGKMPVAVMFYSPACVFCHQMDPYFREFAGNFRGLVLFVRINILTNSWTPERYGVRSTPTFKFFCDGKPVQELSGAVYPALLKRIISDVLAHGRECAKNSTAIDYEITGYG